MSDLVTLSKNSECKYGCGRKNCANPGWPSWMSYTCLETALGIQKARAVDWQRLAETNAAALREITAAVAKEKARADAALGMAAKEILAAFDDACWDGLAERVRTGQWTVA